MNALDNSRIGIAAQVSELHKVHTNQLSSMPTNATFRLPITSSNDYAYLADMATQVEAARLMYKAAWARNNITSMVGTDTQRKQVWPNCLATLQCGLLNGPSSTGRIFTPLISLTILPRRKDYPNLCRSPTIGNCSSDWR